MVRRGAIVWCKQLCSDNDHVWLHLEIPSMEEGWWEWHKFTSPAHVHWSPCVATLLFINGWKDVVNEASVNTIRTKNDASFGKLLNGGKRCGWYNISKFLHILKEIFICLSSLKKARRWYHSIINRLNIFGWQFQMFWWWFEIFWWWLEIIIKSVFFGCWFP